jgi:hypothetical protein
MAPNLSRRLRATWMQHETHLFRTITILYKCAMAQASRMLTDMHASYLSALARGWDDGSLSALVSAVQWCQRNNLPLPGWATKAVMQMLSAPNRVAKLAVADRRNRIHATRWDMVRELRDRRHELKISHRMPDGSKSEGYKPTWDAAFGYVSEALAGTEAAGSPDVIKKSYQLVERSFRAGKGARFHP